MNFTHIKIGLAFAMSSILFGGLLGMSFGCCEDTYKDTFKKNANSVLKEKYNNNQSKVNKVLKKSWVYMKRAHLHSLTMGVISIVISLIAAGLAFPPLLQTVISLLSGLSSIGYGLFWLMAGFLAPSMGSTGAAKETVGLLGQVSTLSFMIAVASLFFMFVYKVFYRQQGSH